MEPDSDLARILDDMHGQGVILVKDGVRFRVEPVESDDIWADYDPEKVRESMDAAAGSWSDVDTERIKESIYAARNAGTRPPDRP